LSTLFADTSALAKRYLSEVGSAWVRNVTAPAAGHVVIIAGVIVVEMYSLLARRGRDGTLAAANITLLGNAFLLHAEHEYLVVPRGSPGWPGAGASPCSRRGVSATHSGRDPARKRTDSRGDLGRIYHLHQQRSQSTRCCHRRGLADG